MSKELGLKNKKQKRAAHTHNYNSNISHLIINSHYNINNINLKES